jgi:hypothetical protein
MCNMCSFVAEAHEIMEVHEKVKHRFNVIYAGRCSQLQSEKETCKNRPLTNPIFEHREI